MTAIPTPIPARPAAVQPVVDYEPPALAIPQRRPPATLRPPIRVSSVPPSVRPAPAALSPVPAAAAAFAAAALRRVLEVIDRRRPAAQLYPLLASGLIDSVLAGRSAVRATGGRADAATLQRVRLQLAGPGDPPAAAEVFGTYRRGPRIHAVACRVQRAPAGTGHGWRVVALHIG